MNPTDPVKSAERNFRYDAFISYSHAADDKLAPAFQSALQRLARPWYRLRAMRVFRDQTGLAVTPQLWESIKNALAESTYFVLLASPAAAQSEWVGQEVSWWLGNRSATRLLIVWTDGGLVWDAARGDFDWIRTTALPARLQGAFTQEPLHLDLRWAKAGTDLSLRQPRFADAVARVAATVRNIPLEGIIGEDVKQHQRTIRLLRFAVATLLVLTASSVFAAFLAIKANRLAGHVDKQEQIRATLQANEAKSRQLAAVAIDYQGTDKELAILLAAEAARIHETAEAESALRQSLAASLEPERILDRGQRSGYGVFSADGTKALTWSDQEDETPQVCDLATGKILTELRGHAKRVWLAYFFKDGRQLVTADEDGFVRIWSTANWQTQLELRHPEVSALLLSPEESRVLTLGTDTILWNAATGAKIWQVHDRFGVRDASFHPDGSRVAVVMGYWPEVLDAKTGKTLAKLEGHRRGISSIEYSPDGAWLVTAGGDDGTLRIWRSATGLCQRIVEHDAPLSGAQFSPDGKWIVARDSKNLLMVWDAGTANKVAQIEILPRPEGYVIFKLSPNGKCLLTASFDADTAELWETGTGIRLGELVGHAGEIRRLHFSADGKRALVGSVLAPARIYATEICGSVKELLVVAGRRVSRQLTNEERQNYLGPP